MFGEKNESVGEFKMAVGDVTGIGVFERVLVCDCGLRPEGVNYGDCRRRNSGLSL